MSALLSEYALGCPKFFGFFVHTLDFRLAKGPCAKGAETVANSFFLHPYIEPKLRRELVICTSCFMKFAG